MTAVSAVMVLLTPMSTPPLVRVSWARGYSDGAAGGAVREHRHRGALHLGEAQAAAGDEEHLGVAVGHHAVAAVLEDVLEHLQVG